MNLFEQYINNLNEKASIDWNNYLTSEEITKFLSKDDKVESAEEIIYNTKGNFYNKYFQDFKKEGWTKRSLVKDLANFYYHHHLTEGIHLFAFVKDEDGNDKVIEDSDYSDKKSFKRDLEANGYKVRRINDEKDMFIMDNSDYRSVNEVKSRINQIKRDIKDGIVLPSEKIELENLKELLNKLSLTESYTLKGIQDGKSFDISYSDSKEKLEKFRDENVKNKNIDTYIIEESEKDRNHFKLWQKQIDSKSRKELYDYYNRLVSRMRAVDKSDKYNYMDLAKKINYLEDTYKIKNNFSYNLR